MALKTVNLTIQDQGRDQGKTFVITEMPAFKAEKWAARALLALAKSGAELPDAADGVAGLANLNIAALLGNLSWVDAEPLLDEMLTCVQIEPSPGIRRPLIDGDVEEIKTLVKLRKEVLGVHFDFFGTAGN